MGRHGRSAVGRAATGRAAGVTGEPRTPYGKLRPGEPVRLRRRRRPPPTAAARSHRKRKTATPVRTGLLGVSAAVALGTVAVASGVVPGTENYSLGGGSNNSDSVQAVGSPSSQETQQGGTSGSASADGREGGSTSRDADRSASPSASAPASTAPVTSPAAPTTAPSSSPPPSRASPPTGTSPRLPPGQASKTKAPKTTAPVDVSAVTAAETEVLKLVNDERAKVGCSPVAANSALSDLAQAFSEDMAARDFFDHTDRAARPWDRAAKAGITSLGGENIARGQADAAAVMEAWMEPPRPPRQHSQLRLQDPGRGCAPRHRRPLVDANSATSRRPAPHDTTKPRPSLNDGGAALLVRACGPVPTCGRAGGFVVCAWCTQRLA